MQSDIIVHDVMNAENIALRDEGISKNRGNLDINFYALNFRSLENEELTVYTTSVYSSLGIDLDEPMMLGSTFLENTNKSLFHKGDIFPLNISTESQRKVMIIEVETNPWIQKQ